MPNRCLHPLLPADRPPSHAPTPQQQMVQHQRFQQEWKGLYSLTGAPVTRAAQKVGEQETKPSRRVGRAVCGWEATGSVCLGDGTESMGSRVLACSMTWEADGGLMRAQGGTLHLLSSCGCVGWWEVHAACTQGDKTLQLLEQRVGARPPLPVLRAILFPCCIGIGTGMHVANPFPLQTGKRLGRPEGPSTHSSMCLVAWKLEFEIPA